MDLRVLGEVFIEVEFIVRGMKGGTDADDGVQQHAGMQCAVCCRAVQLIADDHRKTDAHEPKIQQLEQVAGAAEKIYSKDWRKDQQGKFTAGLHIKKDLQRGTERRQTIAFPI